MKTQDKKRINMINLAGVDTCDTDIKEELYIAGIEIINVVSNGEVPSTIESRIGNWRLRRAWNYWVATVERPEDGLILTDALELHNMPSPINNENKIGYVIRCGGHAGAPSPDEYGAKPIYDETLNQRLKKLGFEERYFESLNMNFIDINISQINKLFEEGKLDVERYVDSYHIDTQIGLNLFVNFISKLK